MLEGTLESFTLPDIFQLLSLTKKTGCLVLHDGDQTGRVYFDDGQVYYALSTSGRLALGRRLVGAGMVSTDALRTALESQQQLREDGRGLRLGQILLEQGAIDEDTLETFVREQIQDAVFDLMRWQQGAFSFDDRSDDARVPEPIRLSVSVENLIMEGSRRLEEWEQVRRKIPSLDAVVAMAPMPSDAGVEVSLKPEEWRLLTVVDGRRTVQDLVDLFGQGEFQTCKVLYGMVGAGLLEIRDEESGGASSVSTLLQQQELLDALEVDLPPRRTPPVGTDDRSGAPSDEPTHDPSDEHDEVAPEDGADLWEDAEHDGRGDEPMDAQAFDDGTFAPTDEDRPIDEVDDVEEPGSAEEHDDVEEVELDLEAVDERDEEADIQDVTGTEDGAAEAAPHDLGRPEAVEEPDDEDVLPPDGKRLSTDPSIDADLVQRLIDGVKGL